MPRGVTGERLPQALNPPQPTGFVSAANRHSVDTSGDRSPTLEVFTRLSPNPFKILPKKLYPI